LINFPFYGILEKIYACVSTGSGGAAALPLPVSCVLFSGFVSFCLPEVHSLSPQNFVIIGCSYMFAIERQRMIKNLLLQNRHVTVTELSDCLNVSEVTIRRDLEKLENEQFLMRTHGGAVVREHSADVSAGIVATESAEQDSNYIQQIASLAAGMVHEGSIIYLGSGMIPMAMIPELAEKQDLIALTCSLPTAAALYKNRNIQVILPGGSVLPNGMLYGPGVQATLESMHVGTAFIEVSGFNNKGFTVRDQETCSLVQQIGQISDRLVFLCPAQAYGHISVFRIGNLTLADSIVTTADIDPAFKAACAKNSVKLYTAFDA